MLTTLITTQSDKLTIEQNVVWPMKYHIIQFVEYYIPLLKKKIDFLVEFVEDFKYVF